MCACSLARHIDNGIEGLVYAHRGCNSAKAAYLGVEPHLDRWLARVNGSAGDMLRRLAEDKNWDSHTEQTFAVARSMYLQLPSDYGLWRFDRLNGRATHPGSSEAPPSSHGLWLAAAESNRPRATARRGAGPSHGRLGSTLERPPLVRVC
jgi:hypothetical protein